jgi:hypothetical protein
VYHHMSKGIRVFVVSEVSGDLYEHSGSLSLHRTDGQLLFIDERTGRMKGADGQTFIDDIPEEDDFFPGEGGGGNSPGGGNIKLIE